MRENNKQRELNVIDEPNVILRRYQVLSMPTRAMPNGQLLAVLLGTVVAKSASEALSLAAQDFGFDNVSTVRLLNGELTK